MKKIYFEPKMRIKVPQLTTDLLGMSIDPGSSTNLPGGGSTSGGDDDEEDDWGGAKGRGLWDNDGLW